MINGNESSEFETLIEFPNHDLCIHDDQSAMMNSKHDSTKVCLLKKPNSFASLFVVRYRKIVKLRKQNKVLSEHL